MITIRSAEPTRHVNYKLLPVTVTTSVDEFNKVYEFWKRSGIPEGIERTPSGAIKKPCRLPCWEAQLDNVGAEITACAVIDGVNMFYRLQWRAETVKVNNKTITGAVAFRIFAEELWKDGVDVTASYIKNGAEVKAQIPAPRIELLHPMFVGKTFQNCHHVDINSSYPAGMADCVPKWRPTIERLYSLRKQVPEYKAVLVFTCGYMQSMSNFGARLAHVSKHAIALNNAKIDRMINYLRSQGCTPLAVNTDGIWYSGELQDINSDKLGYWKTDHRNCQLRFKSAGCYEYIEDGKYTPVMRGKCELDKVKPRDQWQWGDIFNTEPIIYTFEADRGIMQWREK